MSPPPITYNTLSTDRPSTTSPARVQSTSNRGVQGKCKTVHGLIQRYERLVTAANSGRSHRQRQPEPTSSSSSSAAPASNTGEPRRQQQASRLTHQERWDRLVSLLDYVIKDAVALSQVDTFVKKGQGQPEYNYYKTVENFTRQYADVLNSKGPPIYLDDLDVDAIESTHLLLSFFAEKFVKGLECKILDSQPSCRRFPGANNEVDGVCFVTRLEISNTERLRIFRALYRREILMRLYYAGGFDEDHENRQAYLKDFFSRKLGQVLTKAWQREDIRVFNGRFLCLFEPWELEQIVTVDFFLVQKVYEYMHARRKHQLSFAAANKQDGTPSLVRFPDAGRPLAITRLLCDLRFLRHQEMRQSNDIEVRRRRAIHQSRGLTSIYRSQYKLFAPHFFLFEQQATSYRMGYTKLTETSNGELPPFEGEAVDKIPFAWVDAFAGHSPHCRAFGMAIAPVEHKFMHFFDENSHITPNDSPEARGAKLAAEKTPARWFTKDTRWTSSEEDDKTTRSFEAVGNYALWAEWCDLGFVLWDRERVEVLKANIGEHDCFYTGWIEAEALLDAMANARLMKKEGRVPDSGWMAGSPIVNGASAAHERAAVKRRENKIARAAAAAAAQERVAVDIDEAQDYDPGQVALGEIDAEARDAKRQKTGDKEKLGDDLDV